MVEPFPDSIAGIELTEEGKTPMKSIDIVHEAEIVKTLHDPVRLQILRMLNEGIEDLITTKIVDEQTDERIIRERVVQRKVLSVIEMIRLSKESAYELKITKNQMYHHLPILLETGFIIKYGVVIKGKRTTDYYRRTAENFITFGSHYEPKEFKESIQSETLRGLEAFELGMSEKQKQELLKLTVLESEMRLKWLKKISGFVVKDVTTPEAIELFDWLLWIYSTGQKEYLSLLDRIRTVLFTEK